MRSKYLYIFIFFALLLSASSFLVWKKKFEAKARQSLTPQYASGQANKNAVSSEGNLKLMFAGDIMSQLLQIESAHRGDGTYDYTPCFQYIKPIFETADLAIGNLECTLMPTPPYTGYPNFRSPEQLAEALKKGGFDILVTSNNHAIDGGLTGVNNTIDVVKKNGLVQTGTFKDSLHHKVLYPLIVYKNGFKLAILNYTHHTNGYQTPKPSIVNRLDLDLIKRDVEKAKKMNPDAIITFLHWGDEHELDESANQREVARLIHSWGSLLVIGSHPHVVQPIKNETHTVGKQSVQYLTAYSLGNFISAQPFVNTEGGIVVEVDLKKENGVTTVADYHYIPVIRHTPREGNRTAYYALPISPFEGNESVLNMSDSEKAKMHNFAAKTRAHLEKWGAKERRFGLKDLKLDAKTQ